MKHKFTDNIENLRPFGRLVDPVQQMVSVSESTDNFDVNVCVAQWLDNPFPTFGVKWPAAFMDTVDGLAQISTLPARMQKGAYSWNAKSSPLT